MSSLDSITQALAALSITPSETVQHASATSPAAWKEALQTVPKTPKEFELLKVLVFKPKTAKSATPVPVVVVARDDTETSSSLLGKKLNLKELRLASEDLLSEFFSLDKDSRKSPIICALYFSNTMCVSEPFSPQLGEVPQGHYCRRCLPGYCASPARRARAFFKRNRLPLWT